MSFVHSFGIRIAIIGLVVLGAVLWFTRDKSEEAVEEAAPVAVEEKVTPAAKEEEAPSRPALPAPAMSANGPQGSVDVLRAPANRVTTVRVFLYEWEIDMSRLDIPSGAVVFEVQNTGRFSHDFGIRGVGNWGKVRPGESRTFKTKLLPGVYEARSLRKNDMVHRMSQKFEVAQVTR